MRKLLFLLSALFFIVSCSSSRRMNLSSKKSTYTDDIYSIHPSYEVFHISPRLSEIHFKVSSQELLYERTDGINLSANVLLTYVLSPSAMSKEILDSASLKLADVNNDNADKFLIGKVNMNVPEKGSFFLRINLTDLNRNVIVVSEINIEKESELNRQNFLVRTAENGVPLFRNNVKINEDVSISYQIKNTPSIFVKYYNRDFLAAAPPFSEIENPPFRYKEDSLFVLNFSPEGNSNFKAMRKGFYHFQCDTSVKEGFTLFVFSDNFPEIKSVDDMIFPLRYITTQDEYDEIIVNENKKVAMEKFWLKSASSKERTRTLIKKYYNRVVYANTNFSSYLEGWKSDRGMIYIIYGAPTITYSSPNSETWIYGDQNSASSLSFSFFKVKNPFTLNDYSLVRSNMHRQSWSQAVDSWRNGRTYFLGE